MGNNKKQEIKDVNKMTFSQIIIIVLYIFFTISGLLLIKLGGIKQFAVISGEISIELNIKTVIGILCYLISFIIYVVLISNFTLSYIMPLTTGLVYIFVLVSSVLFLNERINIYQGIGAGVILLGVILMNIKCLNK